MDSDYLRQMSIKNAKDAMKQAQTMHNRNNMITIKNIREWECNKSEVYYSIGI